MSADPAAPQFAASAVRDPADEIAALQRRIEELTTRLQRFAEAGTEGLFVHDGERILEANGTAARLSGYTAAEVVGKPVLEFIPPPERPRLIAHLASRKEGAFESLLLKKDGTIVPVEVLGYNATEEGRPIRVVSLRDISQRREVENRLRARETHLDALMRSMSDLVFVLDRDGMHLEVAASGEEHLYRPRGEVLGRRLHDIFPSATADDFLGLVRRALDEHRVLETEYSLDIRGNTQWFQASVSPMLEDRVLWVARDITARRRAEVALRDSEELFRAAFDSSASGIIIADADGRILIANPTFHHMLGYPAGEMTGLSVLDVTHPEERDASRTLIQRVRDRTESVVHADKRYLRKDGGTVWGRLSLALIREPNGAPRWFVAQVIDMTERKHADDVLRLREEQLRQALKMEAVGQLAGGVAHDFNNLLTVILSYSQILLQSFAESDPRRADLEEVRRAADRAAQLTKQLLAFARSQVLQPIVLDANRVIRDLEKMLRRLIGEHITLAVQLSPNTGRVLADRSQLEQVIVNLVLNARDAMPAGGTLTVRTRPAHRTSGGDANAVAQAIVVIEVSDTGTGMDDATRARIFEPFFTTKDTGKGTGLGLATVYGIVKQSGGSIEVESEAGKGSLFRVSLPLAEGTEQPDHVNPTTGEFAVAGTVLLVEDEDSVRQLASRILRNSGLRVIEARNGREAVAQCERMTQGPSLLVTDVVMPEMNGRELAEFVRSKWPNVPVLFISGYIDERIGRREIGSSEGTYLAKPFSPEQLLNQVRELITAK